MESAVVKVATKANVAQLVECIHGKDEVTSSILVIGSIKININTINNTFIKWLKRNLIVPSHT